jgi:hypothetical protein
MIAGRFNRIKLPIFSAFQKAGHHYIYFYIHGLVLLSTEKKDAFIKRFNEIHPAILLAE